MEGRLSEKLILESTGKVEIGPMSVGMDVRVSADSDIKRLQEMVKRLEGQNAQLKNSEGFRRSGKKMDPVKVQLGLDDVPLLDLNGGKVDEEDSWLVYNAQLPLRPSK